MSGEKEIAASILSRAVTLDNKKRYTEALICYQEGLQILMKVFKDLENSDNKTHLRKKIEGYMMRAESLKAHVSNEKSKGSYHEQIIIEDNSTGHSYSSVFGRFLDDTVNEIIIEDAYIGAFHQCQNLVRFCELAVKSCTNLKCLTLVTVAHNSEQNSWLEQIKNNLWTEFHIKMIVTYSDTLHDRSIKLNNGWIIKIGRGLDYFKATDNKFSIGVFDTDLRKCRETTVDIFHKPNR